MSEIDPMGRALVRASRHADEPADADVARVERALMAKIAAGTVVSVGIGALTTKAAAGSALALKVGTSLLLLGLGAGGAVWLSREATIEQPVPAIRAKSRQGDTPLPAAEPSKPAAADQLAQVPELEPVLEPAARPGKAAASSGESAALKLQAEAQLVGEAQRALGSGRAADALAKLEQYNQRFPSGALRIEAGATRVFALCQSGRVREGEAAKRAFLQRFPTSPAAPRIRNACAAGQAVPDQK